jgi:dTDP-glucose 4,6-dehydratase
VLFLIEKGTIGEKYNISGEKEVSNLELAQKIADVIGHELIYEMVDFHSNRPGHDLRYGLDGNKLVSMGWAPTVPFDESIEKTVRWTLNNPKWLKFE